MLDPHGVDVVRAHVFLMWREGRSDAALALADSERKRLPNDPERSLLAADIHTLAGQPQRAIAALRDGLARLPNTRLANRLIEELRQHASAPDATAFEREWQLRAPSDAEFVAFAALQAERVGDRASAIGLYRRAMTLAPQAPLLKNNLAALLLQDGQPKEALPLAEAAAAASPGSPALLDTLARAQAANGKPQDGLSTQERALRLEPDSPALRLTMARL